MTREEAIRKLQKQKAEYLEEWVDFSGVAEAYDMAIEVLEQPERKKGRWVPGREIGKEILTDGTIAVCYEDYKCSSCGLILFRLLHNIDGTPFYKFCPNCGADMRG